MTLWTLMIFRAHRARDVGRWTLDVRRWTKKRIERDECKAYEKAESAVYLT